MPRRPRLHFVSPATVCATVARFGMLRVLSEAERAVFERFVVDRRRRDWLAGRIAAKRALRAAARAAGERVPAYHAITVWNEASGAPCFTVAGAPELALRWNISISHADGAAVAAVADTDACGTVGVDIERTQPLSETLIRRVLTAGEARRRAGGHEARVLAPLVVWTVKEAVLKAGRGACASLRDVELTWSGVGRISARVVGVPGPAPEVAVVHRMFGPFTLALARWQDRGRAPRGAARTTAAGARSPRAAVVA